MPLYSYYCGGCRTIADRLRRMSDRNKPTACEKCGEPMDRVLTAPNLGIWNPERRFPNLSPHGDGTMAFESKEKYEAHLKATHSAELGVRAPVKRPHGNKVIGTWP